MTNLEQLLLFLTSSRTMGLTTGQDSFRTKPNQERITSEETNRFREHNNEDEIKRWLRVLTNVKVADVRVTLVTTTLHEGYGGGVGLESLWE